MFVCIIVGFPFRHRNIHASKISILYVKCFLALGLVIIILSLILGVIKCSNLRFVKLIIVINRLFYFIGRNI